MSRLAVWVSMKRLRKVCTCSPLVWTVFWFYFESLQSNFSSFNFGLKVFSKNYLRNSTGDPDEVDAQCALHILRARIVTKFTKKLAKFISKIHLDEVWISPPKLITRLCQGWVTHQSDFWIQWLEVLQVWSVKFVFEPMVKPAMISSNGFLC